MPTTLTIQAITSDGQIVDERTASTPAGARRSLLAMIDRIGNYPYDGCEVQQAEHLASQWNGRDDFAASITTWNRTNSVTFHASH